MKTLIRAALVGNPNGGKTTLFNTLTGAKQSIGNWSGVTVEQAHGHFSVGNTAVDVVDLPGIYSLISLTEMSAIDECITAEFLRAKRVDVIINIVDATHLERHLYLTTQMLEMGLPVILVLNMMDLVARNNMRIDVKAIAKMLGCPVVALSASRQQGINELKQAICHPEPGCHPEAGCHPEHSEGSRPTARSLATLGMTATLEMTTGLGMTIAYPAEIEAAAKRLMESHHITWSAALHLLEGDFHAEKAADAALLKQKKHEQQAIEAACGEEADILIAESRYEFIQKVLANCVVATSEQQKNMTTIIDRFVLNRLLGIPIFLAVMYLLFVFAIDVGGFFQTFFDRASAYLFVDGFGAVLAQLHAPAWLTALLANGIGKGMNTVITFVPVIGAMFLFLAVLEDSGYMARAAFVVDRLMRALGLPGKAFVPMIVGFGCNVPAVMASRTLAHKRDRILTMLMTPFMSCGARLTIYAVFAAAFFPHGGQNIVFLLYVIGILMAILTGFLLQRTLLQGEPAPLVMELPAYHLPQLKSVLIHAWQRLSGFLFRAGKLIVPICMLIGALNSLNMDGSINSGEGDAHSLLSILGQWMTPIFAPMGIQADNWPATVGLVTGVLAKEVVVGTLNTLYTQMGHVGDAAGVYGVMAQKFDGKIGAFAYLLFVLLYFPCVSTMAVMLREMHRGWTVFSAFWMIGAAYGISVIFYQSATYFRHPFSSIFWVGAMLSVFALTIVLLRSIAGRDSGSVAASALKTAESGT